MVRMGTMDQKPKKTQKTGIGAKLEKLSAIVSWFEKQEDIDVEKGLEKAKEGAFLIRELKERMKEVENEFREIRKDLEVMDERESV